MSSKLEYRITSHNSDREKLAQYLGTVEYLAGMAIEMMEKNPATVLSPIFREMLAAKAKEVQALQSKFVNRLHVDNPGAPL